MSRNYISSFGGSRQGFRPFPKSTCNRTENGETGRNRSPMLWNLGEYAKAKECFDKVLELSRKRGKIHLESCTYLCLSLCALKLGNIYEGNSNIFASINKSEVIRRLQVQEKYKISHFDHVVKEYRLASDFLSKSGFLYEAFYIEEYGRARALADLTAARYSEENEISVTPQRWYDIESIVKKECNCTCLYISYYRQSINF